MITFHCDSCGLETFFNPPTEQVTKEEVHEYNVPDPDNPGQMKKEKRTVKVPEMTFMRMQDPNGSGAMIDQPIPKMKDLKPRAWRVQLRVGQESIDRDFCKKCLDKCLKTELANLQKTLESFGRK